jgi:hypothetical protein
MQSLQVTYTKNPPLAKHQTARGQANQTTKDKAMRVEHGYGDSRMKGLHKYGWFVT